MQRLGGSKHIEAVAAAHLEVAQHDVKLALVQELDRGVPVAGLVDVMARILQRAGDSAPQRVVIVRDQNSFVSHDSPFYLAMWRAPHRALFASEPDASALTSRGSGVVDS